MSWLTSFCSLSKEAIVFDLRTQLRKINSLTKYPSIETYHKLGKKGVLLEEHNVEFDVSGEGVIATEKVDGTNGRVILLPNSRYLVGSREELLTAEGDLIPNPVLGIVDGLQEIGPRLSGSWLFGQHKRLGGDVIITAYLEVFGGTICKASKQYTSNQSVGCRLFDISVIELDSQTFERSLEQIAGWRKRGGQTFFSEAQLQATASETTIKLTPRITMDGVPRCIAMTRAWLELVSPLTRVGLGDVEAGASEGVVLRTRDRTAIAKLRIEDYDRHTRVIDGQPHLALLPLSEATD